jgi:hypothetical protein
MKKVNLVLEFIAKVGTIRNPNNNFVVIKRKKSYAIKSLETGNVVLIITNHGNVWLNKEIFPLVPAKIYKSQLEKAIQTRFPQLSDLFDKDLSYSIHNSCDYRFIWATL